MKHGFVVGDIVLCVSDSGAYGQNAPVAGKTYKVTDVTDTDICLDGHGVSWNAGRFALDTRAPTQAKKEDDNKTRWDIIMQIPGLTTVAEVFTFGAKKYDAFNWRKSKGDEQYKFRLLAAAMRHISKRFLGEKLDPETQKPHLAHAIADLLMVLDLEA